MKAVLFFLFITCLTITGAGQTLKEISRDTVVENPVDTIRITSYVKRFNPRKALFYSAILPGLGQVYNKKYWKVPLVYGGFFLGYYLIDTYNANFNKYKAELFTLLNDGGTVASGSTSGPTSISGLSETQLRSIINRRKRDRDFWCIMTGVWYMLQLVDAHVDAHLKEFDVNPQLKVKIEPMSESNYMIGRSTGFSIKFRF
jgi:hypothetical protein